MKASELKHVRIASSFLDHFFKDSYQSFNISFSGTSKKNTDSRGLTINVDLTVNNLPNDCVLDMSNAETLMKKFLDEAYSKIALPHKMGDTPEVCPKVQYLNLSWSVYHGKQQTEEGILNVSVDFKLN